MSDRFACLKEPTTSNKTNGGTRFNSNKNNNNRFKSNQFNQKKSHNRKHNDRRNYRRDCSNNYQTQKKYSKMLEHGSLVGRGEVSFIPQYKSGKLTQKQRKQEKKKEKLKVINKNDKYDDWNSLQNDDDIALTMAMAEKYQYVTESEEEEEEEDYEHDPLVPDTDLV